MHESLLIGHVQLLKIVHVSIGSQVTTSGQPVYDMDSPHKKPYEIILIGRHRKESAEKSDRVCEESNIPDNKVIVSVPCSIHSYKPPLTGMPHGLWVYLYP